MQCQFNAREGRHKMARFEILTLADVNAAALRLVTFASQSLAVAFLRDSLANPADDETGVFAVVRTDNQGRNALKQAFCRVAGMPRTIKYEKGEKYSPVRGDRAGKTVTALHTTYKPYTTAEYNEACRILGASLKRDESSVVTHTDDAGKVATVATYAIAVSDS